MKALSVDVEGTEERPGWLRQFSDVAKLMGVSVLVSGAAAVLLARVPQVHEANRVLVLDRNPIQIGATIASLGLLCLTVWYYAEYLAVTVHGDWRGEVSVRGYWTNRMPEFLSALPTLGYLVSLWNSRLRPDAELGLEVNRGLIWLFAGVLLIALITWRFGLMLSKQIERLRADADGPDGRKVSPLDRTFLGITLLGVAVGFVMYLYFPFEWGRIWGPLPTLLTGLTVWVPILSFLVWVGAKLRFPIPKLVLGFFLVNSYTGWFDVRDVPVVEGVVRNPAPPVVRFTEWLKNRPDLDQYKGKSYPVIFVYAEGGGIRAATHTAITLARLQDQCPNFAQHLFAVSGVSGGSLGATVFAASVAFKPEMPSGFSTRKSTTAGDHERLVTEVLSNDLLSGILGRMFFTDLPHQILPIPGMNGCDRSKALALGLERSWTEATGGDQTLSRPLCEWVGLTNGAVPSLCLNGTCVETGRPVVISDLALQLNSRSFHCSDELGPNRDLRAADAAGLSARFPIVTTSGVLRGITVGVGPNAEPANTSFRIVDGGYYDNSGLASLMAVLQSITDAGPDAPRFKLILLRIGMRASTSTALPGSNGEPSFPELLSPLHAVVQAYMAGTSAAVETLEFSSDALALSLALNDLDSNLGNYAVLLDSSDTPFPLGWNLSKPTRGRIGQQIGWPVKVDSLKNVDPAVVNGNEMYHLIEELRPQP